MKYSQKIYNKYIKVLTSTTKKSLHDIKPNIKTRVDQKINYGCFVD